MLLEIYLNRPEHNEWKFGWIHPEGHVIRNHPDDIVHIDVAKRNGLNIESYKKAYESGFGRFVQSDWDTGVETDLQNSHSIRRAKEFVMSNVRPYHTVHLDDGHGREYGFHGKKDEAINWLTHREENPQYGFKAPEMGSYIQSEKVIEAYLQGDRGWMKILIA